MHIAGIVSLVAVMPVLIAAAPASQPAPEARGTLVSVKERTVTLQPPPDAKGAAQPKVTLTLDPKAKVQLAGQPLELSDLRPGMSVSYSLVPAKGRRPAGYVLAVDGVQYGAEIVKVEGKTIIGKLTTGRLEQLGKEVRTETDGNTRFTYSAMGPQTPAKPATLKEMAAGMQIVVEALPNGPAVVIFAMPKGK